MVDFDLDPASGLLNFCLFFLHPQQPSLVFLDFDHQQISLVILNTVDSGHILLTVTAFDELFSLFLVLGLLACLSDLDQLLLLFLNVDSESVFMLLFLQLVLSQDLPLVDLLPDDFFLLQLQLLQIPLFLFL